MWAFFLLFFEFSRSIFWLYYLLFAISNLFIWWSWFIFRLIFELLMSVMWIDLVLGRLKVCFPPVFEFSIRTFSFSWLMRLVSIVLLLSGKGTFFMTLYVCLVLWKLTLKSRFVCCFSTFLNNKFIIALSSFGNII